MVDSQFEKRSNLAAIGAICLASASLPSWAQAQDQKPSQTEASATMRILGELNPEQQQIATKVAQLIDESHPLSAWGANSTRNIQSIMLNLGDDTISLRHSYDRLFDMEGPRLELSIRANNSVTRTISLSDDSAESFYAKAVDSYSHSVGSEMVLDQKGWRVSVGHEQDSVGFTVPLRNGLGNITVFRFCSKLSRDIWKSEASVVVRQDSANYNYFDFKGPSADRLWYSIAPQVTPQLLKSAGFYGNAQSVIGDPIAVDSDLLKDMVMNAVWTKLPQDPNGSQRLRGLSGESAICIERSAQADFSGIKIVGYSGEISNNSGVLIGRLSASQAEAVFNQISAKKSSERQP